MACTCGWKFAPNDQGLDARHRPHPHVAPADDLAEHHLDRAVRALREDLQQLALPLEQAAQSLRDGEGHVAVRDVVEDLLDQLLAEQRAALGLAARTEVARLAAEGQKMLTAAA